MGWKSGMAKGAAIGSLGGLGGLGGALIGGAIGAISGIASDDSDKKEKNDIFVDKKGIFFFKSATQIKWKDIKNIVSVGDEGAELFQFNLRGGLSFLTGRIGWDYSFLQVNGKVTTGTCNDKSLFEIDFDSIEDEENREQIKAALENVFWAYDLANKIRDSDHIVLIEFNLLRTYYIAYLLLRDISDEFTKCDEGKLEKMVEDFSALCSRLNDVEGMIKSQLLRVDGDDKDECDLLAGIFANTRVSGKGVEAQARLYDNLRNAKAYGHKFTENEIVDVLTRSSSEDNQVPLGDEQWGRRRKMIVCTDTKAALATWQDGLQIPNVMVMDAQDIIAYNDAVGTDMRLDFESGHPQNGMTYIQHPMKHNVYYEVESFHRSMLMRKFRELIKLLDALGATTITCSLEKHDSIDEKQGSKVSGEVGVNVPLGGISVAGENSVASSKLQAVYEKLEKRRINKKPRNFAPYVPDGLLFYQFEEDWQDLANSVLNGRCREEETTFTYQEDYAITGKSLTKLSVELKSLVPGYTFGVEGKLATELDRELKQLKSRVWHYHVVFDDAQSEDSGMPEKVAQEITPPKGTNGAMSIEQARELFLKRARRYAKTECVQKTGMFSEEQQADLDAFALKYGIGAEKDSLIERAFE